MHLALDVHYGPSQARGACVGFEHAAASEPAFVIIDAVEGVPEPYQAGQFKKRELPFLERLVALARKQCAEIETIIVDGYVWLGDKRPGLGYFLHESVGGGSIIGVAKTKFSDAPAVLIRRGLSATPLFITSVGLEPRAAATFIASMHGEHRLPTLLKRVDRASRDD